MNDPLAQFRNIKVPLWARLLGAWRAKREAKRLRQEAAKKVTHIATIYSWVWVQGHNYYANGIYTLYRNGSGERWFEYSCNPFLHGSGWKEGHTVYGSIISPWLNGKWDDDQMHDLGEISKKKPERQK